LKFTKLRERRRPFPILVSHFFGRFFRNEIVDFEDQMKERLIAVLSVLAIIVAWISKDILFKYIFVPDANLSWQDKDYILILMMMIFGIITLFEWETLFLDRQDFQNLTPLPIKLRTIFGAKLASFIAFVGLFSLAMAGLSSILFSIYLWHWRSPDGFFTVRYVFAHLVSAFAACLFVFFACVFLRFFMMAVLPFRFYQRVSLGIRFLLITLFAFFFFAFLLDPSVVGGSFRSLARLKDAGDPFIYLFPPLWFTGLYEFILGNRDTVFRALAGRAGLALLFSIAAFVLAGGFSYVRHVHRTLEVAKARTKGFRAGERIGEFVRNRIFRHPEEKAVSDFFSKTIRSGAKQRMTLVNFVAAAAALDLLLLAMNRRSLWALTPDNTILLVQPILFSLVLLIGMRAVVVIPIAPEARWIFQITETTRRTRYVAGLKKALFFKWLLPLDGLVFFSHALLWRDGRSAFNHALFVIMVSGLGTEAVFFRFRKIPFACPYVPGKMRIETRGIPAVVAFCALLAGLAFVEKELLRNPGLFLYAIPVFAAATAALGIQNRRFLRNHSLLYDEKPEPIMVTLGGGR